MAATQYRKKPVVIEAIQLTWDNWSEVCDFVSLPWFQGGVFLDDETKEPLPEGKTSNTLGLYINTLESDKKTGALLATMGDWIVKGVNGEFYPVKDEIFRKTYESASAETGAEIIAAERQRQIDSEGWTPEHDDTHRLAELSRAATVYAHLASAQACCTSHSFPVEPFGWPWDYRWWKPSADPVRNLAKAGALIAAEIDRLKRREQREKA